MNSSAGKGTRNSNPGGEGDGYGDHDRIQIDLARCRHRGDEGRPPVHVGGEEEEASILDEEKEIVAGEGDAEGCLELGVEWLGPRSWVGSAPGDGGDGTRFDAEHLAGEAGDDMETVLVVDRDADLGRAVVDVGGVSPVGCLPDRDRPGAEDRGHDAVGCDSPHISESLVGDIHDTLGVDGDVRDRAEPRCGSGSAITYPGLGGGLFVPGQKRGGSIAVDPFEGRDTATCEQDVAVGPDRQLWALDLARVVRLKDLGDGPVRSEGHESEARAEIDGPVRSDCDPGEVVLADGEVPPVGHCEDAIADAKQSGSVELGDIDVAVGGHGDVLRVVEHRLVCRTVLPGGPGCRGRQTGHLDDGTGRCRRNQQGCDDRSPKGSHAGHESEIGVVTSGVGGTQDAIWDQGISPAPSPDMPASRWWW